MNEEEKVKGRKKPYKKKNTNRRKKEKLILACIEMMQICVGRHDATNATCII
jgi:hypothetical protein